MNRSESKYFKSSVKMNKALIEILEIKDFEYITIKEICDKAQVNRSTFYLHYNNTVDLLEETGKYLENEFLSYFSVSNDIIRDNRLIEKIRTCPLFELNYLSEFYLHPFLKYIYENQRVFLTVLSRTNSFKADSKFENMFEYIFNPILARFQYPENQRRFIIMFYLNGIVAIVVEWLKGGCSEPIEEIAKIINTCVHGMNQNFEVNISRQDVK